MSFASSIALALVLSLAASPCRAVTVSAPYLVKDIIPKDSEGYQLKHMTGVGDTLFFATRRPSVLWRTDGTAAGTVPVADVGSGNAIAFGNSLVFKSSGGLWTSDGTEIGTSLIAPILWAAYDVFESPSMVVREDTLFVLGCEPVSTPGSTCGLWRSDGTPAGTTLVKALARRYGGEIATIRGMLVFLHGDVWTSDGTAEGTRQIVPTGPEAPFLNPHELRIAGDLALFTSCDHGRPCQLWRTDGTDEGTFAIATLDEYYNDEHDFTDFYPTVLPSAAGDGSFLVCTEGGGVWSSDGTAEGTPLGRSP